jgi:hypothetical protein
LAIFVATDYKITLNAVNLTDHLVQVQTSLEAGEVETTTFGKTWRTRVGGLKTGSVTLQFNQDFAASNVDATIWPLLGGTTTIVVSPTSSAIGTANPSYSFPVLVNSYEPFNSNVGDLATVSITWPTAGEVTRAIA